MLNAIIQFSIRNKLIVGIMVAALIVAGIIHIQKLPIDALPDITSNQVQVITVSPALAAPEVERLVTFTVEQNCSNIQCGHQNYPLMAFSGCVQDFAKHEEDGYFDFPGSQTDVEHPSDDTLLYGNDM